MSSSLPPSGSSATQALDSAIRAHPFLASLKAEHLSALQNNAIITRYEAGEKIFREGDPANRFYLIRQGKVALESSRRESEPVLIQHIGPGDVLGWSWLFPPYYWHFDAQAVEPTEAIFFYGTRLREQCEADHEFGYELMKRMAVVVIQRLQATRTQLLAARAKT